MLYWHQKLKLKNRKACYLAEQCTRSTLTQNTFWYPHIKYNVVLYHYSTKTLFHLLVHEDGGDKHVLGFAKTAVFISPGSRKGDSAAYFSSTLKRRMIQLDPHLHSLIMLLLNMTRITKKQSSSRSRKKFSWYMIWY